MKAAIWAAAAAVTVLVVALVLIAWPHTRPAVTRPLEVINGQVQPCPQVPEALCANGTDCCG
jgi:hypothetical protein